MLLRKFSVNLLSSALVSLFLCLSAAAQNDKKIACAVLIDNTGSLRSQFPEVLTIGETILLRINQGGPVSIFHFETQELKKNRQAVITSGFEWGHDRDLLGHYLDGLQIVAGDTTLLDAINSMAEVLNHNVSHEGDASMEKVIFLITDGDERASKTKEKQLLQKLKESSIKVYVVGMVKELDRESGFTLKSRSDMAVDLLERITKKTGGRAVFSKSNKDTINSLVNGLFTK